MRLVSLYAGDEKNLSFAEDVAKLRSHMEVMKQTGRWVAVEGISEGINLITTAGGGKPLSADGIRGIQQLIGKVCPSSNWG
jgi:ABC-type transporter MlaC component